MQEYHDLLKHIQRFGRNKTDRTGTGTRSVFGYQMRFDLSKGLPLVTTKKLHLKSIIHELIWFLAGDTNIKYLNDNGVRIWDEWADANGDLGPVYGGQWRAWKTTEAFSKNWQQAKIDDAIAKGARIINEYVESVYLDHGKVCDRDRVNGKLVAREGIFAHTLPEYTGYSHHTVVVVEKKIDQITDVMNALKNNPDSRRIIVSAWNVADIPSMKLPPCHSLFQLYVDDLTNAERNDLWHKQNPGCVTDAPWSDDFLDNFGIPRKRLSCQLYQRSADVFLGVPFNIASYALLTHMFAQQADMAVGDFIWTSGDTHIYSNHVDQVNLQLSRDIRPLPQLVMKRKPDSIFDYKFEDFEIVGYDPHPAIKAEVAV